MWWPRTALATFVVIYGTVLGGGGDAVGEAAGRLLPAAGTALDVGGVLGDLRRGRGSDVEDLTAAYRGHRYLDQRPVAAGADRRGRDGDPLVRIVCLPHGGTWIAGLFARLAPRAASREDPPRGRLPGPSEDGGFDEVEESFDSRSTRAWTCVVSSAIWTSN
jgi:hypothetical protein